MRRSDRHIQFRGGSWRYERNVPRDLVGVDPRAPSIRVRLDARDIQSARRQRDALAFADDELWQAMRAGVAGETEWQRHQTRSALIHAVAKVSPPLAIAPLPSGPLSEEQTAVEFRNAMNAATWLLPNPPLEADRFQEAVEAVGLPSNPIWQAATVRDAPKAISLRDACRQHIEDEALANRAKSPSQKRKWEERRWRAVNTFTKVLGRDPKMDEITKGDAWAFWQYWRNRILAEDLSPDMARKDFGSLRAIYKGHFDRDPEGGLRVNPFDGLTFARGVAEERTSLSPEWIAEHILKRSPALDSLNREARDILIVLAETGARPSEICNLPADAIRLGAPVPHISIAPRRGRALKAKSSRRDVPLVGAALEAMKRHPGGFPRYADKEDSLSAVLMKALRPVLPEGASVYSLRHAYVDRLRAAGVGDDLRRAIVGHSGGGAHTGYGRGFPLSIMAEAMQSISLPFDPALFAE